MYKSISELAQINPGNSLPSGVRPMDDVSFIPMSDVSESGEWTGRQVRSLRSVSSGFTSFSDNDVLVAKITPCFENGKGTHVTNLVNGAGFGSTEFHVLRAYPGVSPRFIHHVSQSAQLRRAGEAHMVGSAGQKRVPREFFDVFKVPDFSHDEQIKISHVLDTLDTTIHQTEAIIEKLKQVKQGLLHDLLTRGIDANGELRPPQSEAPELYKESALGWIPKGWNVSSLKEILAPVDPAMRSGPFGSALLKDELVSSGYPLLGIDNVQVEHFLAEFSRFVTEKKFNELARYAVRPHDLMITIMGTVGRCCTVPKDIGNALSSKHTWTLTLDQTKYLPTLAMLQINYAPWVLKQFAEDEQGGIMSAIRSDTLRKLILPTPPIEEQHEIELRLNSITQRIEVESVSLAKAKLEKSGLMDDLLTGRMRVTPLLESAAA